jgi:hypothetical protein
MKNNKDTKGLKTRPTETKLSNASDVRIAPATSSAVVAPNVKRTERRKQRAISATRAILGPDGPRVSQPLPWWLIQREKRRALKASQVHESPASTPLPPPDKKATRKSKRNRAAKRAARRLRRTVSNLANRLEIGSGLMPILTELASVIQTLVRSHNGRLGLNTASAKFDRAEVKFGSLAEFFTKGHLFEDPSAKLRKSSAPKADKREVAESSAVTKPIDHNETAVYVAQRRHQLQAANLLKALERATQTIRSAECGFCRVFGCKSGEACLPWKQQPRTPSMICQIPMLVRTSERMLNKGLVLAELATGQYSVDEMSTAMKWYGLGEVEAGELQLRALAVVPPRGPSS